MSSSMQAADRRALVDRLEVLARERPRHYRLRVTALALLGLAYRALIWFAMFAVPIALTLAFYPTTWSLTVVVVLLLLFGLFWFRPPRIEGKRLHASDAPELFARLEAMRAKTGAPHVHEVVLSEEFNASAAQLPRLGLFGWHKQVLELGIPLLATLTREQVLAVVGHELGHFSKAHGRMGHWIYRTRYTWEKLQAQVGDEDSGLGAAVNQFYRSFVPYFSAYSFVLARLCEYEADADSARASDHATAASALAALHAYGAYLGRGFWPALWRTALGASSPPDDVYRRLAEAVRSADPEELEMLKRQALERASDLVDTHPCLADRLRSLRVAEVRLSPPEICAGQAFLGARWDSILDDASRAWSKRVAQEWGDDHRRLEEHARRLAELRATPEAASSLSMQMEIARITHSLEGPQAALVQWRELSRLAPDDPRVAFRCAKALAYVRDAEAFAHFEAVATMQPGYAAAAAEAMKELALSLGDRDAADRYEARRRAAEGKEAEVWPKLAEALQRGTLEPHRLQSRAVALLARQLQADNTIAGAYIAGVRCEEAKPYGAVLLMIRIDPEAMARATGEPISITDRCRALMGPLLEPNEFVSVLNFYITEDVDEKIAAGLATIPSSRLFGNLDRPEGLTVDPRSVR
jgi:Zn-dependent protease with chaperone function